MKATVFECVPLRSGWIVGWMMDGERIEQIPQLRLEAKTPFMLRAPTEACIAIFSVDGSEEEPPRPLVLGPVL